MTALSSESVGSGSRWTAVSSSWVTRVLGIYALSRVFALALLWRGWSTADLSDTDYANATFPEFVSRVWDGQWYSIIADEGYPEQLPRDGDGDVEMSPWAFFPLFPMLARVLMRVTGMPWEAAAPGLSVVFGALAMLLLFRLLQIAAPDLVRERPGLPYSAVAAMSFFPAAGAFSMGYTDSLALLLVLATLTAIARRRYLVALVPLVLLGFTRAVALPMAAVVTWHLVHRCRQDGVRSISRGEWVGAAVLSLGAVASGFAWMVMVGMLLGSPDGYLQAQSAWRFRSTASPFSGWTWFISTWWGWALLLAFCVAVVAVVFSPFVRRLGPELQAWGGTYTAYLMAATAFGASTPRYLMLAIVFPLILAPCKRSFRDDLVMIGALAALQAWWIHVISLVDGFTP